MRSQDEINDNTVSAINAIALKLNDFFNEATGESIGKQKLGVGVEIQKSAGRACEAKVTLSGTHAWSIGLALDHINPQEEFKPTDTSGKTVVMIPLNGYDDARDQSFAYIEKYLNDPAKRKDTVGIIKAYLQTKQSMANRPSQGWARATHLDEMSCLPGGLHLPRLKETGHLPKTENCQLHVSLSDQHDREFIASIAKHLASGEASETGVRRQLGGYMSESAADIADTGFRNARAYEAAEREGEIHITPPSLPLFKRHNASIFMAGNADQARVLAEAVFRAADKEKPPARTQSNT